MILNRVTVLAVFAALACAPKAESARGDTLATIDTLKPATDTLPTFDSIAAKATPTVTPATPPPVTGTKTSTATKTKTKRDSIIGYDVTKPLDPNKRLLDTVKKKPPR